MVDRPVRNSDADREIEWPALDPLSGYAPGRIVVSLREDGAVVTVIEWEVDKAQYGSRSDTQLVLVPTKADALGRALRQAAEDSQGCAVSTKIHTKVLLVSTVDMDET